MSVLNKFDHVPLHKFIFTGHEYIAEAYHSGFFINPVLPASLNITSIHQNNALEFTYWLNFPWIETLESQVFRVCCFEPGIKSKNIVRAHFTTLSTALSFCKDLQASFINGSSS